MAQLKVPPPTPPPQVPTKAVPVTPGMPDLVPVDLGVSKDAQRKLVRVTCHVRNVGNAATGKFQILGLVDGTGITYFRCGGCGVHRESEPSQVHLRCGRDRDQRGRESWGGARIERNKQ